jgi:hypothetical protein
VTPVNEITTMRILLLLPLLLIAGCLNIEPPRIEAPKYPDPIRAEVDSLVKERDEARSKQGELIKTSKQALDAAAVAEKRAQAADEVAREARSEAKTFREDADRLRNQEVADKIRFYSWLTVVTGAALVVFGVLLLVFGSTPVGAVITATTGGGTAKVAIAGGVAVVGLGLFGLWVAPHWIWGAWIAGASVVVFVAGVVLKVLRDKTHETAQGHTAVKLAAEYGDRMEALVNQTKSLLEPAAAGRLERAVKDSKIASAVDQAKNKVHGLIDRIRKPAVKVK